MKPPDSKLRLPPGLRFIERDWLSSNMILIAEPDGGATLIDTGYVKHAAIAVELVELGLARLGAKRLSRILNTHLHSDHCGGNAALAARYACEVWVPEASFEDVRRWDTEALSYAATAQRCERFEATGAFTPGQTLALGDAEWKVLAAPGHDPKSVVFYCPEHRTLISADVLWQNGFGVIFPELAGESGFAEQQAMLDLIATLDVETVLPGHGPAFDEVTPVLLAAHKRLAGLRADPVRNARYGLKVMIKYLMLDLELVAEHTLRQRVAGASVLRMAAGQMGLTIEAAFDWAVTELIAQGALRREEERLCNV
jgi:glyoxylase-like metal-dependent hydrolase (beta-lactamase superfamily II)